MRWVTHLGSARVTIGIGLAGAVAAAAFILH